MTTNELMRKIAADVFPHGAVLTCAACGNSVETTTEQCGAYLRVGWPRCCGFLVQVSVKETA